MSVVLATRTVFLAGQVALRVTTTVLPGSELSVKVMTVEPQTTTREAEVVAVLALQVLTQVPMPETVATVLRFQSPAPRLFMLVAAVAVFGQRLLVPTVWADWAAAATAD
jgi:hypothetical protein